MVDLEAVNRAWERYRRALEQMANLDSAVGSTQSPSRHNRLVTELRAQRSILRTSPAGLNAILTLLSDPRPVVRLWAASDVLGWAEQSARPVLKVLSDDPCGGLHAVSAKHVLREFDAGRLD